MSINPSNFYIYCREGNKDKLLELLEYWKGQTNVNVPDKLSEPNGFLGFTSLHEAVSNGHSETLDLLLTFGANINSKANGYTPLHVAAANGHTDCIRVLIRHGADTSVKDQFQKTAIDTAVIAARTNIVKILNSAALLMAVETDSEELDEHLATPLNALEDDCLQKALMITVDKDHIDKASKILVKGVETVNVAVVLDRAIEKEARNIHTLLLMVRAAQEDDVGFILTLSGEDVPGYSHPFMEDPLFAYSKGLVAEGRIDRGVLIITANRSRSKLVMAELLMRTNVCEETKTVDWSGLRLDEMDPDWLKLVPWVKELLLNNNEFVTLPENVADYWNNVTKLDLSSNLLKSIPSCLLELPHVKQLNLSNNKLGEIPNVPAWPICLTTLNLSHNMLTNLPSCEAANLLRLDLSHNNFVNVPHCVGNFTKLLSLSLSHNSDILELPDKMGRLKNLTELKLEGLNDIAYPPRQICVTPKDCINYLRSKFLKSKRYYRMKLILVGRQARGKTTLVLRLLGEKVREGKLEATVGVDISEWTFSPQRAKQSFTFNIWDFGGQEEYYATHQCFLTERSLYLLVWNITHGEEGVAELKPWLDNIALRAPNSRVIIVATFYDKVPEADREPGGKAQMLLQKVADLAGEYDSKLQVSRVTFVGLHGTLDNLEALKHTIYEEAETYEIKEGEKLMGRSIPASYHALDAKLSKIRKEVAKLKLPPTMHAREYKDMIRSLKFEDIESDEEIKTVTLFLHENGSLLYYDDRKNNLDDLYFVDPRWLCDMMSTVVTIHERNPFINNGIIQKSSLPLQYKGKQFPEEYLDQYLVLLDRFEVALPLDQLKSHLLIPSMLPHGKPSDTEPPRDPICQQRHILFPVSIPPGLWSRLLARIMHSIKCVRKLTVESQESFSVTRSCNYPQQDSSFVTGSTPNNISYPHLITSSITPFIERDAACLKYWRTGICYRSPSLYFSVQDAKEVLGPHKCGISIFSSPNSEGRCIQGSLHDLINSLIDSWYPVLKTGTFSKLGLDQLIVCYQCLLSNDCEPHMFTKTDLFERIKSHQESVPCPKGHVVALVELAPDLLLADIKEDLILKENDLDVDYDSILGKGGFGSVYEGKCKGQPVAIKFFETTTEADPFKSLFELRNEAIVLQQNRYHHPSLVSMVGVIVCPKPALVMEVAPMGSLDKHLKRRKQISRVVLFRIATQIASALECLHKLSLIYRDLKSANVLLWSLGLDDLINCKLTDFGITAHSAPIGHRGLHGTAGFTAPEVAYISAYNIRATYDKRADIYSLAMTLYEMITQRNPYCETEKHLISTEIEKGIRPKIDHPIVRVGLYYLSQMMKRCWKNDPSHRPPTKVIRRVLCRPRLQLTIGVCHVECEYSLQMACCQIIRGEKKEDPPTSPLIRLWLCAMNHSGSKVFICRGHDLVVEDRAVIPENQGCCMAVVGREVWVSSRSATNQGNIRVFSSKTESIYPRFSATVSCITCNKTHVFLGTMEGHVYMYNLAEVGSDERTQQRHITDSASYQAKDQIKGLVATAIHLWVSHTSNLEFCNLATLAVESSQTLPVEVRGYIGQLKLNEERSMVWGAHLSGHIVTAWCTQSEELKFHLNVSNEMRLQFPDISNLDSIITAMCPALDTIWCGMASGHILLFSEEKEFLLCLQPYRDYVRFLEIIPASGPCGSEDYMVVSGGKGYMQDDYLEGFNEDPMQAATKEDPAPSKKDSQPSAGTVILWEALKACYIRQIRILSEGDAWTSHEKVKKYRREWEMN